MKEIYLKSTFKAKAVTGPAVYYLGIVDFLQDWTTKKKIERLFKIYFGRKDPDGLSVMEPIAYMERFQNKMVQIFDVENTSSEVVETKETDSSPQQPMKVSPLRADDVVVKKHYAYTVLQDETRNPLADQILEHEEAKPAINSLGLPPLPKRRLTDTTRSVGSGSNYGDDSSVISETERLRRGLNPALAVDPYQYVYDVISQENSPNVRAVLEDDANLPAIPLGISEASPNTRVNPALAQPKNDEFNDYVEL